ncbi:hypothetical protein CSB92_2356 [Pseudomonas aeruginosa]|nr:hypothetical protein CSC27_6143 [Pseudomonas aeruginosa]PRW17863.1 hypothetical protein CSB92_2356 [Pseudomonas aeruginosa]BAQ36721.1 hypothetical protein PA257_0089 [Pseudomonas aeruginosa]
MAVSALREEPLPPGKPETSEAAVPANARPSGRPGQRARPINETATRRSPSRSCW